MKTMHSFKSSFEGVFKCLLVSNIGRNLPVCRPLSFDYVDIMWIECRGLTSVCQGFSEPAKAFTPVDGSS